MDEIIRYIDHNERERYQKDGWTVRPIEGHHGHYSVMAIKPVFGKDHITLKIRSDGVLSMSVNGVHYEKQCNAGGLLTFIEDAVRAVRMMK